MASGTNKPTRARVITVLDSRFADTHLLLLCASPLMLYERHIREHVLCVPFRKTGHQFGRAVTDCGCKYSAPFA